MASGRIIGEKRTGSSAVRMDDGIGIVFSDTYEFLVEASSKETRRSQILLDTPGLPIVGFTLTENGGICKSKSASRNEDHPLYWEVKCEFSSEIDNQQQDPNSGDPSDPTTWIPLASIGIESHSEEATVDAEGNAIVNSARMPFDYSVNLSENITTMRFWQYEDDNQSFFRTNVFKRDGVCNANDFQGFPSYTLLLNVESATFGYYYGKRCWKVEYVIKYKRSNWNVKLLDIGPMHKKNPGVDDTLVPFRTDGDGIRYIGKLESNGGKRPDNLDPRVIERLVFYGTANFQGFLRVKL